MDHRRINRLKPDDVVRRFVKRPQVSISPETRAQLMYDIIRRGTIGRAEGRPHNDLCQAIGKATGFEVVLLEECRRDRLSLAGKRGLSLAREEDSTGLLLTESVSGQALRGGKIRVVNGSAARRAHPLIKKKEINTLIAVPLREGEILRGALTLAGRKEFGVGKEYLTFLEVLAAELVLLLDAWKSDLGVRASEERYRHLFSESRDTILVVDPESGNITEATPSVIPLSGYTPEDLRGKPLHLLYLPAERARAQSFLASLKKKKERPHTGEMALLRKDGTTQWIELHARLKPVGQELMAVLIARDITERKHNQVKISASEDLLHIIVEGTLDMFFYVHNMKGVFTYVSPSVERITGHSVNQWTDHYTKFLTNSHVNLRAREFTEAAMRDGVPPPPYPCEIRHANGSAILLEINERPIHRDGKVIGIQGVARDITDRKRWEQSLIDSEEKYRSLFNSVRDGIFQCDANGSITSINKAGAEILGFQSPVEVIATGLRWVDIYLHDKDHARTVANILEEGEIKNVEFMARRRNGEEFPAEGSAVSQIDKSGRVTGYDGTFRDISVRKRLEAQLIQSQKMESIGLLAGGIAHDFNNILGGILGYASLLKSLVQPEDKIYAHLTTIERSATRAAELTSKLLAFARGGKYVVKPVDINASVEETARLLRGTLDKSIDLKEELEQGLRAIEADASQIQQVLMNLCVNARDAMPLGGQLRITTRRIPLRDAFLSSQQDLRNTEYISVAVSDTGTGIEPATLEKIFDPFFTTKEKGKGTGLGLATVYGIVKNHGGYIDVRSTVGVGTTFSLYFPTIEGDVLRQEESTDEYAVGRETILVVDDEDTMRALARDVLTPLGYTVIEAIHGREAIDVYARPGSKIDLVILDVAMPVMGGKEALSHLLKINHDVKVILSTGYAQDSRTREMMQMGVSGFIQKPYGSAELSRIVRSVLDGRVVT